MAPAAAAVAAVMVVVVAAVVVVVLVLVVVVMMVAGVAKPTGTHVGPFTQVETQQSPPSQPHAAVL